MGTARSMQPMDEMNWDASQLQALARGAGGPVLVRGRAGSGRTAVAIGHALRLVSQQSFTDRRILFATPFELAARAAAERIAAAAGDAAREILVVPVADLCRRLIERGSGNARSLSPAPADVRAGFLDDAIGVLRRRKPRAILGRSSVFFSEEISEVIKGRALGRRDDYLALDREGRWRGLEQAVRQIVWEVYEEYQARLAAAGLHDPDDLPLMARAQGIAPDGVFDDVVVDDAHGLSRAALLLLCDLAATRDRILVLLDDDQRYHRQGFSLRDAGIDVRRSIELTGDYRPAQAIRELAESILHGETLSDEERASTARQAGVEILEAPDFPGQFGLAAERAGAEIARGVAPEKVAILTATRRELLVAREALRGRSPHEPVLLTIDDARGLEFESVIIAGVNEGTLPADEPGHDLTGRFRDRRRLYVACTRARTHLTLVAQSGMRSSFL